MSDRQAGPVNAPRALILADFNSANLAAYLTHDTEHPRVEVCAAPLGDIGPAIHSVGETSDRYDVGIVWTRPEGVSPSLARLANTGDVALTEVLADVDEFAATLARLCERCARVIVVSWQPPRLGRAFSAVAMKGGTGLSNVVMRMNLRLAERIDRMEGVTCLDSATWMQSPDGPLDSRLWYAAKVPFRNEVFKRATLDIKSFLRASLGESRKLIILDLDDTLWGGLVGEVGWEALRVGGHDPVGEAHVDFQRALAALSRRGVLLAISSKNEERVALTAIEEHPEMVLRRKDFVAWRINWQDKAQNIVDLTRELNLGLDSVVFIDDSRAERARVREALPDVLVPDWPATPLLYVDHLLSLRCFDMISLTAEDQRRAEMYAAESARVADRHPAESTEGWLRRLAVRVQVEEFGERNAARAEQLFNKTNQMNLSTRRLTANELEDWLKVGHRRAWTYRVSDRFGDAGLTGIASLELDGRTAILVDFILSCRVFGRGVEQTIIHHVAQSAIDLGARDLVTTYRPTERNGPCLQFLQTSGLCPTSDDVFRWELQTPYPLPPAIEFLRAASE